MTKIYWLNLLKVTIINEEYNDNYHGYEGFIAQNDLNPNCQLWKKKSNPQGCESDFF